MFYIIGIWKTNQISKGFEEVFFEKDTFKSLMTSKVLRNELYKNADIHFKTIEVAELSLFNYYNNLNEHRLIFPIQIIRIYNTENQEIVREYEISKTFPINISSNFVDFVKLGMREIGLDCGDEVLVDKLLALNNFLNINKK
jgi:hypothetical protein